jgi:large subunit ribosomal protein L20
MPRVKGGTVARKRRKKILKLAKGYFGSKRTLYRTAHEQVMRSLSYAYRDRKQKKREFRKLWITRINAAAKLNQMKYSQLIHGLALANVEVNRKMLADIAIFQPEDFTAYCNLAKEALKGNLPKKVVVKEVKKVVTKKVVVKEVVVKEVKEKTVEKVEVKEVVDYSKMLVKDLKALAEKKNIEGFDKMLKADLVAALTNSK